MEYRQFIIGQNGYSFTFVPEPGVFCQCDIFIRIVRVGEITSQLLSQVHLTRTPTCTDTWVGGYLAIPDLLTLFLALNPNPTDGKCGCKHLSPQKNI